MAVPTADDIINYAGTDDGGTPADTDGVDIVGAIDTGTTLASGGSGVVIATTSLAADDEIYGGFYKKNTAAGSGTVNNARIANLAGAILNAGAGVASFVSTSALDTGKVLVVGKVSGSWDVEIVTLTGTTLAYGETTWDANSVYRYEHLNSSSTPAYPTGIVSCYINGVQTAIIRGSSGTNARATLMASAETEIALCTAKDTTIASTTRQTSPATVGSYGKANIWTGTDNSIAVPGNELENGSYIGIAVKLLAFEGIAAPLTGYLQRRIVLLGNPAAS